MKKLGIRLLALTLLATVTTGCASSKQENTWDKIKEKKEIVIGTEGTFAPFSYHDDNDNLVGYDVEVSRALAKELGVKVKFVEVKWDSLIAGLDSDKYDFSIPHTYSYPAIITKKDNTEITKMSDIKGRKFSQTGSSNFSKIVEKYKGEIVATNDWNENVSLVEQGRVDGTVNDTLAYYDLVNKKPDTDLKIAAQGKEVSEQAFIFNKGQDDLKKNVDKALKSLKKSGKLAEISNKYFKTDVSHK